MTGRRTAGQRLSLVAASLVACAGLIGCTDDPAPTTTDDFPGLWVLPEPPPGAGSREALIEGVLRYDAVNGCFQVELEAIDMVLPIVWCYGTKALTSGEGVVLQDGTTIRLGETVSGGGGYDHADQIPYDIPSECLPPTTEVAVLG